MSISRMTMAGVVRTYQRCPKCGARYPSSKGEDPIICPSGCHTQPTKFIVELKHKNKTVSILCDRRGEPLDSWRLAVRVLEQVRAEIDANTFDPTLYRRRKPRNTFGEFFWGRFLGRYKEGSTKEKYATLGRCQLDSLHNIPLHDLRAFHIDDWWQDVTNKGLSPQYCNAALVLVMMLLRLAKRLELIERIPSLPYPLKEEKKVIEWLSRDDQLAVLDKIPEHDRPVFRFMMITGCRVMEAAALQREDVDRKNGLLYIRHTTRNGKLGPVKQRAPRIIPITDLVDNCLRAAPLNLTGFVFVNHLGRPYSHSSLSRGWEKACAAAGIKHISLKNATRHSFGMQHIARGADAWRLSKAMGHSDVKVTERYVEMITDQLGDFYSAENSPKDRFRKTD